MFQIVSAASREWVRPYMLGLPIDLRDARRDEIVLLTSFVSLFTLNVLGSLLDFSRDALVANILGVTFAFLLARGFLLLGLCMRDRARRIPLAIGAVFLVWMFVPRGILLRWFPSSGELLRRGGDSPLGVSVFS